MRFFSSMLLAVDGSATSEAALDVACSLANAYGGTIAALHVLPGDLHLQGRRIHALPEMEADKRRAAFAIARAAEDRAKSQHGVSFQVKIVDGDPVDELLAAAETSGADTIVLGNRGQNALATLVLGSVAHGIMERSRRPVLVVNRDVHVERSVTAQ